MRDQFGETQKTNEMNVDGGSIYNSTLDKSQCLGGTNVFVFGPNEISEPQNPTHDRLDSGRKEKGKKER
jgi:hypothetical protein